MNGFPFSNACANYANGNTGIIHCDLEISTSFETYNAPCGFDVMYTWYGKDDFTFTLNSNQAAIFGAGLAYVALGAFQALF